MKFSRCFMIGSGLLFASVAVMAADPYKDAVLADKPFAYYRLDETADTAAVADEIGDNPGVYVNDPKVAVPGAISTNRESTAVSFARGQSQYIKLTALADYGSSLSSGFAVEYWLKTGNSTEHQNILGTANGPGFVTDFLVDIAYEGVRERFRIYCRDNHSNRFGADFFPVGKNLNIYDDQWHYIVHVYDPKAKDLNEQILLYVDGARQTLTAWRKGGVPRFSDFNNPVVLGAMNLRGTQSDSLDGSLDEVAFYKDPLSAGQIQNHFRASGRGDGGPVQAAIDLPWQRPWKTPVGRN